MGSARRDEKGRFLPKVIDNEQEIIDFYLSGDYFYKEVAEHCNCQLWDVPVILKKYNIPIKNRSHKKKLPTGTDAEIIEFYATHNIHLVSKKFNTTDEEIKKLLIRNGVKVRSKEESAMLAHKNGAITKELTYGDPNYSNTKKASETRKNKSPEEKALIYDKCKNTLKEKYDDEHYNINKGHKVLVEKYGEGMFLGTDECKKKTKEFAINNFGSLEEYNKWVQSKAQQSLIDNFGSPCGYQSEYAIKKARSEESKIKAYNTKKANKSFNTSKPEDAYYEMLIKKFGNDDVKRQYYDKERYPFQCDFYIKSLDLFIECNYNWTHGIKIYDANDIECKNLVDYWKSKTSGKDYWAVANYVYTDLDVRKKETAIKNNINYMMVYQNKVYNIKNGGFIEDEHVFGF